jgi:hypothetical protein
MIFNFMKHFAKVHIFLANTAKNMRFLNPLFRLLLAIRNGRIFSSLFRPDEILIHIVTLSLFVAK